MTSKSKSYLLIEDVLTKAGIQLNGSHPWDVQVHDERFYDRVFAEGTLSVGESYMDGWWDAEALDETIFRIVRSDLQQLIPKTVGTLLHVMKSKALNLQTKTGSKKVAEEHYDIGNDLYTAMLDPYLQYSCAYFKDTDDLNKAEEQKMDLICKKLQLKEGDRVLDIGCGWGGLAKWMAEKYGCHVTGVSISEEQVKFGQEFTKGLPVEILNMDYRDLTGTFDKIVSVGMFEHVGYKNYRTYMETVKKLLKPDGLFLLHTIGRNDSGVTTDPWIEKYIFPNSMLPSIKQVGEAIENVFIMEDWHNFGAYYDKTLLAWYKNFEKAWPSLQEKDPTKYNERFRRMFRYYLLLSAGDFRARDMNLWQVVLSPKGVVGGYTSVR